MKLHMLHDFSSLQVLPAIPFASAVGATKFSLLPNSGLLGYVAVGYTEPRTYSLGN